MKKAIVFSGQGAQFAGMGQHLFENNKAAKEIFLRAQKLNPDILKICFEGIGLEHTLNAQPALFVCGVAGAAALEQNGITFDMCAGFSAGEIAALCYSGMVDFETGFHLITERAKFMHSSAQNSSGAMAAVLGNNLTFLKELLSTFENVYIANYNCPGQIVIAGDIQALDGAIDTLKANKIRAIKLKVAGAFHTPFMQKAAAQFKEYVNTINFLPSKLTLYSNTTTQVYANAKELLPMQITSAVRWQEQVENMNAAGAQEFYEVGAGSVLANLIKKTVNVRAVSAADKDGFDAAIKGEF